MEFLEARGLIVGTRNAENKKKQEKTEEKLEQYIQLAEKGLTIREAAEQLGCTVSAVRNYAYRNKISFEKETKHKPRTKTEKIKEPVVSKQKKQHGNFENVMGMAVKAVDLLKKCGADILTAQIESDGLKIKYRDKDKIFALRVNEENE